MKRKLKKLHEILAMYPEYKVYSNGVIKLGDGSLNPRDLSLLGREIEVVEIINFYKFKHYSKGGEHFLMEDWFEPLPVEEKWYRVTVKRKDYSRPVTMDTLHKSKDDYLSGTRSKEEDFEWIHLEEFKRGEK